MSQIVKLYPVLITGMLTYKIGFVVRNRIDCFVPTELQNRYKRATLQLLKIIQIGDVEDYEMTELNRHLVTFLLKFSEVGVKIYQLP